MTPFAFALRALVSAGGAIRTGRLVPRRLADLSSLPATNTDLSDDDLVVLSPLTKILNSNRRAATFRIFVATAEVILIHYE